MTTDLVLWYAARVAGLASFAVLAGSLLTGMAIRTAYLAPLARNRSVVALHGFLSWFWVPLIAVHVVAIVLDTTARVGALDVVVPFRVGYSSASTLAVGAGTIGFLMIVVIALTSALRRRMSLQLWRWIHRLTYPMFVVVLVHAQLAGSDFSRTAISVAGWATIGMLLMLAVPRAVGGRMEG
jgi:DMSO/TMAO reductase YedYZ heme-binding membrane subunit